MLEVITVPLLTTQVIGRLALATAFGAIIGLNRELERKPAGLRTHALVALGAALITVIALHLSLPTQGDDSSAPSRLLQGLLAGIGFLGGGVILRRRHDPPGISGLTTAASLWVVSGVGIGVGAGMWRTALAAVALTLVVLVAGDVVDRWLRGRGAAQDPR